MAAPKNTVTSGQLTAADLAATLLAEDGDDAAEHAADGDGLEVPDQTPAALPVAAKAVKAAAAPGQRVKKGAAPVASEHLGAQVIVRITKKGHGEVHDGDGGVYDWNDEVVLPLGVAQGLEDPARAFGEIVGNA